MAKLVVKFNNDVVDHIELRQGDMKVGRKPGCDVLIDNLAVSGEHANIFTVGGDSFIQDLGSTNGTFINNKRITKHHLRDGDTVTIGKHSLIYLSENMTEETENFAKTVIINPGARENTIPPAPPRPAAAETTEMSLKSAGVERQGTIFVLGGPNSGRRIELTKSVTNLGKTGKHAGIITRTDDGYILAAGEGERPTLNGRPVHRTGSKLKNGDIIDIAGTRLQFYLK